MDGLWDPEPESNDAPTASESTDGGVGGASGGQSPNEDEDDITRQIAAPRAVSADKEGVGLPSQWGDAPAGNAAQSQDQSRSEGSMPSTAVAVAGAGTGTRMDGSGGVPWRHFSALLQENSRLVRLLQVQT